MSAVRVRITAAIMSALACALGGASCVQGTEPASETEACAPASETKDDGDPFGEPEDPGGGESAGDTARLAVCVALGPASAKARAVFCDTLCDRGAYARCRSHLFHSRTEWTNWCYFEFG
jgi:hypothetical protein